MIIAICLLIIFSIWARYGTFFINMTFKKYMFVSAMFASVLFLNRSLYPGFTLNKCFICLTGSVIIFILFTLTGYYFFNKLCPERKPARYIYFCAYFIFILAFCSQYPFTMVWEMYKKEVSVDLQHDMVKAYLPTAKLFGINSLDIKLLQEDMLGAFVIPQGDHAKVVITGGLKKLLTDEELCFVMAHEFTHYKENHHQVRLLVAMAGLFLFFLFTFLLLKFMKFDDTSEFRLFLRFVPLQLLLLALLSLYPLYLARAQEMRADLYAVEIIKDKNIAVSTFEKTIKVMPDGKIDKYFVIFEIHPTTEARLNCVKNL
ncbi:MAG: M48 family metalloprotease [Candidatus Eremiobacterota bacterium]